MTGPIILLGAGDACDDGSCALPATAKQVEEAPANTPPA